MDVETSPGPAPLLNGFSATNDANTATVQPPPAPNAADAGVLIDFDPIQSPTPIESAAGKADTSGELLKSFDPFQPTNASDDLFSAKPVTITGNGDNGDSSELGENGEIGDHDANSAMLPPGPVTMETSASAEFEIHREMSPLVQPDDHHVLVVPDEVLSAPPPTTPPTTEDEIQEHAILSTPEVVSEDTMTESTPVPDKPEAGVIQAVTTVAEADKTPTAESEVSSPPSVPSAAAAVVEGTKPKSAAHKSNAVAPKASPAGPTASATKKTTSSAVSKSTPSPSGPATSGTRSTTAASTSGAAAGTKLAANTVAASTTTARAKSPRPTATVKTPTSATTESRKTETVSTQRRTPRSTSTPAKGVFTVWLSIRSTGGNIRVYSLVNLAELARPVRIYVVLRNCVLDKITSNNWTLILTQPFKIQTENRFVKSCL